MTRGDEKSRKPDKSAGSSGDAGAPARNALARNCTMWRTGIQCAYASRAIPVQRATRKTRREV